MNRPIHSYAFPITMAKPTKGGRWLAAERTALGLTCDSLGAAIEFASNTIRAVESGERPLTPRLLARAKAYFAKERRRQAAPEDAAPSEGGRP
jgi:plasmid maintenance system antidote protein VapI